MLQRAYSYANKQMIVWELSVICVWLPNNIFMSHSQLCVYACNYSVMMYLASLPSIPTVYRLARCGSCDG